MAKLPYVLFFHLGRQWGQGGGDINQLFHQRTTLSSYLGESIYEVNGRKVYTTHYSEIRKQACKKE
jgi:hypothetical protein